MAEDRAPRGIRLRDGKAEKPEGTYTIECFCTNCDWQGDVEIPRGTPVPYETALDRLAKCENCACETLMRFAADEELTEDHSPPQEELDVNDAILEDLRRHLDEVTREQRRAREALPPPISVPDTQPPDRYVPPQRRGDPYRMPWAHYGSYRSSSAEPAVSNTPKTRHAVSKSADFEGYGTITNTK